MDVRLVSRIHNRWVRWQAERLLAEAEWIRAVAEQRIAEKEARSAILKASLKSKESSVERVREAEQKAKQKAFA